MRQSFPDGHTVAVVGDGTAFTNDAIAQDGNASLALGLLGAHPGSSGTRPTRSAPAHAGPTGLSALLPSGSASSRPARVAVLVAALWRGRRLGPVVIEELPVLVRAAETTEGRARLYRRRRARGRRPSTCGRRPSRLSARWATGHPDARTAVVTAVAARAAGRRPTGPRCCTVPPRTTTLHCSVSPPRSTLSRGRSETGDAVRRDDRRPARRTPRPAHRGRQGRRRPGRRRVRAGHRPARSRATCCSKACPAWPRRCWCARWPPRSTLDSSACSSRPT